MSTVIQLGSYQMFLNVHTTFNKSIFFRINVVLIISQYLSIHIEQNQMEIVILIPTRMVIYAEV